MENAEYWAERFTALDDKLYKKSEEYARTLQRQFDRARRTLTRDLGYWYGRLAENNGISYAEAKKLLKDDELADFHLTVAEYIKHGKEDGLDPAWIKKLENASARVHISRLEQMQMDLEQTIEDLYFQYETGAEMLLESVTTTSYYYTAYEVAKGTGIGVNLHRLDIDTIKGFLTTPWCKDGNVFSDRIWARKDELTDALTTLLAQNLMTGADPQRAIDQIAERFDVDKRAAGRLIMTETAAISSEARKQCLKELDVEEFEIVATLDSRTSDTCRRMDGQHFPMSQYKIGFNAPPFHCNCRSTTVPYFNDEFTADETRAAREPGDTGYKQVPSDMTYEEWEDEFLTSKMSASSYEERSNDWTGTTTRTLGQKEISELRDYAKNKGVNLGDISHFDGDPELLKEEIDQLSEMQEEYKYISPKPITLNVKILDDDDFAITNGSNITINTKALRDRSITIDNLTEDSYFAAKEIKDIVIHEFGHVIASRLGNKGFALSKKACYNLFHMEMSNGDILDIIADKISGYAIDLSPIYEGRNFRGSHYKEILPELLVVKQYSSDAFIEECAKLLKEVQR